MNGGHLLPDDRLVEVCDGGTVRRRDRITHPLQERDMSSMQSRMFAAVALVALAACAKEQQPEAAPAAPAAVD